MKFKKLLLSLLFLSLNVVLLAQAPANDNCSGAVTSPQDGSCTAGTTVGAGDSWAGSVGCAGNNEDVWYTFVATGTQSVINVTSGTMGGNIELVLVSATGACSGLGFEGSSCGASPLSATFTGLAVGTTYYYTLSSTGATGTFSTCVTSSSPPATPGQDCPTAEVLCNSSNITVGTVAAGAGTISGSGSQEDLSTTSCLLADERQAQWYIFTAGSAGNMQFLINPNTNSNDYDFALYDITTAGCDFNSAGGAATLLSCNFSGCPGTTGIVTDDVVACATTDYLSCAGSPSACNAGDIAQFNTTIPALTSGNSYALYVDNYSVSNDGFAMNFTGTTASVGPNATFSAALTASCASSITITRTPYYTGTNMTYSWNFGDGGTSTSAVPTYTYAAEGVYTIQLTVTDVNGCTDSYSQTMTIGCPLSANFTDFNVYKNNKTVDVNWTTASEENNSYFSIERSADAKSFEEIGKVSGATQSTSLLKYNFNDKHPLPGISYYRLKQVDFDGRHRYTTIKEVFFDDLSYKKFKIYPNPSKVNNLLNISLLGYVDEELTITIMDMQGTRVFEKTFMNDIYTNKYSFKNELDPGIYTVKISNGNDSQIQKLVLTH